MFLKKFKTILSIFLAFGCSCFVTSCTKSEEIPFEEKIDDTTIVDGVRIDYSGQEGHYEMWVFPSEDHVFTDESYPYLTKEQAIEKAEKMQEKESKKLFEKFNLKYCLGGSYYGTICLLSYSYNDINLFYQYDFFELKKYNSDISHIAIIWFGVHEDSTRNSSELVSEYSFEDALREWDYEKGYLIDTCL